jgi:hypothetical protein
VSEPVRFIIRSSYGNDSVALIQWAHEQELEGVVVVYSDTGWARKWWATERVPEMEAWARSLGFRAEQVVSAGMETIVQQHKGWPFRLAQFCTEELKIRPMQAWLAENDPDRRAVILTGLRREESFNRRSAPAFRLNSPHDGGRVMVAPLVEFTEAERNALLERAGVAPLEHRSEECRCINSGRRDIARFDEDDLSEIERIEAGLGNTSKGKPRVMFRPNKFMGATGIREIKRWADSERGKYEPAEEEESSVCQVEGWCG